MCCLFLSPSLLWIVLLYNGAPFPLNRRQGHVKEIAVRHEILIAAHRLESPNWPSHFALPNFGDNSSPWACDFCSVCGELHHQLWTPNGLPCDGEKQHTTHFIWESVPVFVTAFTNIPSFPPPRGIFTNFVKTRLPPPLQCLVQRGASKHGRRIKFMWYLGVNPSINNYIFCVQT